MIEAIKKIPLALAGLVLAITALANLLKPIIPVAAPMLQLLALSLLALIVLRLLCDFSTVKKELANPLAASCFATFFMTLQLLSSSLPLPAGLGRAFWFSAFLFYLAYLVFFSYRFARQRKLDLVYPSWFIVYVGFAMVGVSAPAFKAYAIGWSALVFAGLAFAVLLPFVIYRLFSKGLDKGLKPILAIFAAPASLLLTAYLSLAEAVNPYLALGLLILSQFCYAIVVFFLYKLMASGFSPLYSAFTFPMVSTAISLRLLIGKLSVTNPILLTLSYIQIALATLIVAYVLASYLRFLTRPRPILAKETVKISKDRQ